MTSHPLRYRLASHVAMFPESPAPAPLARADSPAYRCRCVPRAATVTLPMKSTDYSVNAARRQPVRHSRSRFRRPVQDGVAGVTWTPTTTPSLPSPGVQAHADARNQFAGTIKSVQLGSVMAEIVVTVGDLEIVSAIMRQSAESLDLKEGDRVVAVIKSTEVLIDKR